MEKYKITFEKDYSLITSFNGTLEDAKEYFLNNYFNMCSFPIEDMVRGVEVVQM